MRFKRISGVSVVEYLGNLVACSREDPNSNEGSSQFCYDRKLGINQGHEIEQFAGEEVFVAGCVRVESAVLLRAAVKTFFKLRRNSHEG